jgi:hypothetical protein
MFVLCERHLRRLCTLNYFPISSDPIVLFGLRGCLPVSEDSIEFRSEHALVVADPDYLHPRCVLGQWKPTLGTFALFPGSTVPHRRYLNTALFLGAAEANQLIPGRYVDYRREIYRPGDPRAHEAFQQERPLRRSADSLHAAWCMGVDAAYRSAGCQVVIGFPRARCRGDQPDEGPWKAFKESAYDSSQTAFTYFLLTGRYVQSLVLAGTAKVSARLRYGSAGSLVSEVGQALTKAGFYQTQPDEVFGARMLEAVQKFQMAKFGAEADDGVVGPITASALGISWPRL